MDKKRSGVNELSFGPNTFLPCFTVHLFVMNPTASALQALFNRIPRRHSLENVKDINSILAEYEDILITIEAVNPFYEKKVPVFFDDLEAARATIKRSTDNKVSKKSKDSLFDEGSGNLKDSMQALMDLYEDGGRTS
jgi:hypothetical protein